MEIVLKKFNIMKKLNFENIKKCCKNCGKLLILKINRDITRKNFCSRYCSSSYTTKERHRLNPTFTLKAISSCNTPESNKKKGIHPNYKPTYKIHNCIICNTTFEVPLSRHNKGYGKCCSKKCWNSHCKHMRIKTNCLNCNKEIFDLPKRNRKYCSCSCRMIHLLPKQKMFNTKIELKIKSFLEEKNIQFDFQPLIKDIVNADFLIYPNIVIFADGDYWHSLPYAIKRDQIVNEKLKHTDYVSLRFKEKDINNNFDFVQNKIMETYNARSQ